MTAPIVIVGGGLAAGTAATTLRECGYGGDVVVFADESHPPYERPPLSKAYLRGQVEAESTYLHPQSWYAGNNVDLRTSSRVDAIDIETRRVQSSGAEMPYSKLLLVTGSRARLYPILGTEHVTVQYLRTLRSSPADGCWWWVGAGSGWKSQPPHVSSGLRSPRRTSSATSDPRDRARAGRIPGR
jgi:3-phenylpropionate/trans-cinnamate dioxygenase ferredoxin reductase subunit